MGLQRIEDGHRIAGVDHGGMAAVMDQPQVIVGKGGHGKYR